jgi:hypothetical protein
MGLISRDLLKEILWLTLVLWRELTSLNLKNLNCKLMFLPKYAVLKSQGRLSSVFVDCWWHSLDQGSSLRKANTCAGKRKHKQELLSIIYTPHEMRSHDRRLRMAGYGTHIITAQLQGWAYAYYKFIAHKIANPFILR